MPRKAITTARLNEPEPFVGTKEAALILGVSISTVQKMVDAGTIRAWRTEGGHRRLALESLKDAAQRLNAGNPHGTGLSGVARVPAGPARVLVVEDNAVVAKSIGRALAAYEAKVQVTFARDAAEALLKCSEMKPDLIITDLVMEPFDGFHLIRVLRNSERLASMHILVVTGLSPKEIAAQGGLGEDVIVYRKPLSNERLAGFLDAFLMQRR